MIAKKNDGFGLIKTLIDAHTMGVYSAASLLRECGYQVHISPAIVEQAMERIRSEAEQKIILDWIADNNISHIGFSYRLDPDTAVDLFGRLVYLLKSRGYYGSNSSRVKSIFFAGLSQACEAIEKEYSGLFCTFRGGETPQEALLCMGVPYEEIPGVIKSGCKYDLELLKFGEGVIQEGKYKDINSPERNKYPEFGTKHDTIELRVDNNYKGLCQPIIRAHSGPYSDELSRAESVKEFYGWCEQLGKAGLLDVLSIGTSQLSQSCFGEDWRNKPNGGGVPVNSELEYSNIWNVARPMLVRTYAGTKNIRELAEIYERSINNSWHALSLWWFDELDGRGTNSLYDNLREHIDTMRYVSSIKKPVETNVSHHFAFRGADDITYIISGYLGAKTAKKQGIHTFILQNMLNTPRSTWGIQDLAKSRILLKLIKELEDSSFRILFQTRAGLDYFKPDIDKAKVQLAAVTAMMDDIDPQNMMNPDIIHVVSYSEAMFLATPDIINDSIRITRSALQSYRNLKKMGYTPNVQTEDIKKREMKLEKSCREIIAAMEEYIPDLYSARGLYLAYVGGWLPTPELWSDSDEFKYAREWETRMHNGGVVLYDQDAQVSTDQRINRCVGYVEEAQYILKHKYGDQFCMTS